jgi:hypothetical protein
MTAHLDVGPEGGDPAAKDPAGPAAVGHPMKTMRATIPESHASEVPAPGGAIARDLGFAKPAVYAASGLSLAAALMHLWATPAHFLDWWGYGSFVLAAALAQGLFAALFLRWPGVYPLLVAGIAGNLALVLVFVLTRTYGVPAGPHAGELEATGALDVAATAAELGVVFALTALLGGRRRRVAVNATLALGVTLWALRLVGVIA